METKGVTAVEGCYTSLISAYCKVQCGAVLHEKYEDRETREMLDTKY